MEVSDLLEQIDIVEFLSDYTELVEKSGEYWGLSPLANPPENTPSFSVRREARKFYDFSTGIGGSLVTFLQHYYKITPYEAINRLKEYAGVSETGSYSPAHRKLAATTVFAKYTPQKKTQKTSKITALPDNYMERYEMRNDKLKIWENEGISKESLAKFQVRYDSFANRLVYPIRNTEGKIVNIGGRALNPDWKERGERKYTYYRGWEGGMSLIYGLSDNIEHIKSSHQIILFEGCKSVLIADTWGIHNTGAILTSHLNPAQMKILVKLGCDVVFALDKDVRVRDDHNIDKLKRYVNVSYLYDARDLLDEKDSPVDKGEEIFRTLYSNRLKLR